MNSQNRQGAVILTSEGIDKFPPAKTETKSYKNCYEHYTLEALGDRTGKDPDTLIKVIVQQIFDRVGAIVVEITGEVQFMTQRAGELLSSIFYPASHIHCQNPYNIGSRIRWRDSHSTALIHLPVYPCTFNKQEDS